MLHFECVLSYTKLDCDLQQYVSDFVFFGGGSKCLMSSELIFETLTVFES